MNSSKNIFRLTQLVCQATKRSASSTVVPSKNFPRLKAIQQALGAEDGIPVHLKSGFKDRILFVSTWGLVSVGTVAGLHTFYTLVFKE